MIYLAIIVGCIIGAIVGTNAPMIPYSYSIFLAIGVIAALDSVLGGVSSILKKNFDFIIFITGFFCNAILAMLLTYLGQKLNVDIYIAAIFVFINRMFINLTIIRRYYVEKWSNKIEQTKKKILSKDKKV
ncbi:MAG: small basic family protein [Clostridia bacterium]|nr:small basic family protein [Clostridia bacterium]